MNLETLSRLAQEAIEAIPAEFREGVAGGVGKGRTLWAAHAIGKGGEWGG
jgi:hypothetical protein